jgi:hypothetical protein
MAAITLVRGFQDPDDDSKGLSWIQKDPSDKKDYQRTWTDFLGVGETISSVTWVIHDKAWAVLSTWAGSSWTAPPAGALTGSASPAPSNTTTAATVWLEGGTASTNYLVTCRVTSSAGRVADESFQVRVLQR